MATENARPSLYDRMRCHVVHVAAHVATPPMVAVVGCEHRVIYHAIMGMETQCKDRGLELARRVWIFHWGGRDKVDARRRLGRTRRHGWRHKFPSRLMRWVGKPGETAREKWEKYILKMAGDENVDPFGLVVHVCQGARDDILGDLDTLLPCMTDTTMLALADMRKRGAQSTFAALRRDGWDGVRIAGVGLMQRRPMPTRESE